MKVVNMMCKGFSRPNIYCKKRECCASYQKYLRTSRKSPYPPLFIDAAECIRRDHNIHIQALNRMKN